MPEALLGQPQAKSDLELIFFSPKKHIVDTESPTLRQWFQIRRLKSFKSYLCGFISFKI